MRASPGVRDHPPNLPRDPHSSAPPGATRRRELERLDIHEFEVAQLGKHPPEMVFPHNALRFEYRPAAGLGLGLRVDVRCADALLCCDDKEACERAHVVGLSRARASLSASSSSRLTERSNSTVFDR